MSRAHRVLLPLVLLLGSCDEQPTRPACLDDLEYGAEMIIAGQGYAAPSEFAGLWEAWECARSENDCERDAAETLTNYNAAIVAIYACVRQVE